MGGGGKDAGNTIDKNPALNQMLDNRAGLSSDPKVAELLAKYGTGGISLNDAMAQASSMFGTGHQLQSKDDYLNAHMDEMRNKVTGSNAYSYQLKGTKDAYDKAQSSYDQIKQQMGWGMATQADLDAAQKQLDAAKGGYDSQVNSLAQGEDSKAYDAYVQSQGGDDAGKYSQFMSLLATDPSSAQRYMTDQLQTNSLTKGLFGAGGLQDQTLADAKKYSGAVGDDSSQYQALLDEIQKGDWQKLTPEDQSAYGQMSGDIARMYGSQEASAAQSLADRGLGSGYSGAAGATFSGIQGNKMEQLASAQRQVLQDRVNTALQGFQLRGQTLSGKGNLDLGALNSARTNALNLGTLGNSIKSNMFNQAYTGRQANESELANASDRDLKNQVAYQNQANQQFQQNLATSGPGLGDILGAAGGSLFGSFTGGLGTTIGSALGGKIAGQGEPKSGNSSTSYVSPLTLNGPLFAAKSS